MPEKILIIDDEQSVCWAFQQLLSSEGYTTIISPTAEDGLKRVADQSPDLVILDIRLPGMNGIAALEKIQSSHSNIPVIIITAYGTMDTAIEAIKKGAYDYLTKPIDIKAALLIIKNALSSRIARVTSQEPPVSVAPYCLVGKSKPMEEVFKKIGAVSKSDATVLIIGESGTGKELAARAIHHHSQRSTNHFETINCAALPETLLESELFGHEKGAFTGAIRQKPGKFELADSGTIFLDEISQIPLTSQTKLLRFIETKQFERLGSAQSLAVDVRIIAASNQNLQNMVSNGTFREDLFYRLNVVSFCLPPLRERKEDISFLIQHFLTLYNAGDRKFSESALDALHRHNWHGNVRELKNVIEYTLTISRNKIIQPENLPEYLSSPKAIPKTEMASVIEDILKDTDISNAAGIYDMTLEKFEKPLLEKIMSHTNNNQLQSSKILGISRATLIKKLKKYNLI